jgi:hypothetical protein
MNVALAIYATSNHPQTKTDSGNGAQREHGEPDQKANFAILAKLAPPPYANGNQEERDKQLSEHGASVMRVEHHG